MEGREGGCAVWWPRAHLQQASQVESGAAQKGMRKLQCQKLQDARKVHRQLEHDHAPALRAVLHAPAAGVLVVHLLRAASDSDSVSSVQTKHLEV